MRIWKQVTGKKGEKQWKRVEVKLEDHINVPIFPIGLSPDSYDKYFDDYISEIAMNQFLQNKPLWEIHIVKYPTSNAAGTIIFNLHALGDGYSLMGALLSSLQRADNPSLPLTFPFSQRSESKSDRLSRGVSQLFSLIFNTIYDFGWSMLKSNLIKDDRTLIRSGEKGVEFQPITISTMTLSLDHIKFIKDKLGVVRSTIYIYIYIHTHICNNYTLHFTYAILTYYDEIWYASSGERNPTCILLFVQQFQGTRLFIFSIEFFFFFFFFFNIEIWINFIGISILVCTVYIQSIYPRDQSMGKMWFAAYTQRFVYSSSRSVHWSGFIAQL